MPHNYYIMRYIYKCNGSSIRAQTLNRLAKIASFAQN
jgi:hypothetical protein